jgi:hypothetical protein
MPRLVRRQPLLARIQAYLNPLDFLLWLSEEIDSNDWDEVQRTFATPIGLGLNFVFLIARANSGSSGVSRGADDVFGDGPSRSGYLAWLVGSRRVRSTRLGLCINVVLSAHLSSIF